jgi:hypothetical protein
MNPPSVHADAHPSSLVFDSTGRFAYISCSHGCVCQYRIRWDGVLVPLVPSEVSIAADGVRDPSPVIFDKGGRSATVLADGSNDSVVQFSFRVGSDGTLKLLGSRPVAATAGR